MDKIPLSCIILAGGKSLRMGEDKTLLPFAGYPSLTIYQYERLKNLFSSLHVSTKSKEKFSFEAPFLEDEKEFKAHSPLVAIYTALKRLKKPLFFVSVDTPFVDRDIFEKLYANLDSNDAVVARCNGKTHQLCAIYTPALLPLVKKSLLQNRHKIRELFNNCRVKFVDFSDDKKFYNLNYKDEYLKAKEMIK